mmetsp:Transcript_14067/g.21371  ORF Transcript_14067/g.21371 Transcript_14067/m.21371 type:complete len:99 (-) Transcript_14067:442-738(-)
MMTLGGTVTIKCTRSSHLVAILLFFFLFSIATRRESGVPIRQFFGRRVNLGLSAFFGTVIPRMRRRSIFHRVSKALLAICIELKRGFSSKETKRKGNQ